MEPKDDWVLLGLIVVIREIYSVFSEDGFVQSWVVDGHVEESGFSREDVWCGVAA